MSESRVPIALGMYDAEGNYQHINADNPMPSTASLDTSETLNTSLSNATVGMLSTAVGAAVAAALLAAAILAPMKVSDTGANTSLTSIATNTASGKQVVSSSATVTTSAAVTTLSVQIVGANAARKGFFLWNNSANSCYCSLAATATSAAPAMIVATFTSWTFVGPVAYTGPISCIRNSGTGTISVTELI